ncbi:hypothetical protein FRX31_017530, partial [Thalictrum thalictroides]
LLFGMKRHLSFGVGVSVPSSRSPSMKGRCGERVIAYTIFAMVLVCQRKLGGLSFSTDDVGMVLAISGVNATCKAGDDVCESCSTHFRLT